MLIDVDVFAKMIGLKPGELIFYIRSKSDYKGCKLPSPTRGSKGGMKFKFNEVINFCDKVNNKTLGS